jgi:hypothetical protein
MGRLLYHIEGMGDLAAVGLWMIGLAEEGELEHLGHLPSGQIDGPSRPGGSGRARNRRRRAGRSIPLLRCPSAIQGEGVAALMPSCVLPSQENGLQKPVV